MSDCKPCYFAVFSHEYEAGHSGEARSYWDIKYGTPNDYTQVGSSVKMAHSSAGLDVERVLQDICYLMDQAVERGKAQKLGEFQTMLGMTRDARASSERQF